MAWCRCGGGSGEIKLGAYADFVGVGHPRIYCYQLMPTATTAEALLRQFPERIAGLDAHGFLCGGRGGTKSGSRFRRAKRRAGRDRSFGKNIWLRERERNRRV